MAFLRFHKSLPLASVYFLFNRFDFFPEGLLITSVLSPIFYIWLLRKRKRFVLGPFFLLVAPFTLVHSIDGGIHWRDYTVSFLLLLTVYVTAYAFAVRLHELPCSLGRLVRPLIWINFAVACVGLLVRFTPWYTYMWVEQGSDVGGYGFIRYRMFTYEASDYALTIAPLVLYAYWQFVGQRSWNNLRLLVAAVIPFFMASSFGVIGCSVLGILISQTVTEKYRIQVKWILIASVLAMVGYASLPSTSNVKARIDNILTGNDSSANLRAADSYVAAYKIAGMRDLWFGAGIGQAKLYVPEVETWSGNAVQRLPCVMADTLATFGILGFALRLLIEGSFFVKGKTYKDPFRLSLFIVLFTLQFGGSYMSNSAEYCGWIVALSGSLDVLAAAALLPGENLILDTSALTPDGLRLSPG
jgi:hypothetical protein